MIFSIYNELESKTMNTALEGFDYLKWYKVGKKIEHLYNFLYQ